MIAPRQWLRTAALGVSGCLTLVIVAVVVVGIRGCPRPGTPTRPGARVVPVEGGPREGEIQAIDFAVDGDRVIHLIWLLRIGDRHSSYVKSQEVWYRRGDLETNTWGKPRLLASKADGPPRIVRAGDTLHVIVPYHLRHFVSGDSGSTWTESTPLLHPAAHIATHPEVAVDGDSLIVVYLSRRRDPPGSYDLGPTALFVTAWGSGALGSTHILYESSDDASSLLGPRPRLDVSQRTRHVCLAVNHMIQDAPGDSLGGARRVRFKGTLCCWESSGGSGSWSRADSSEWPEEVYSPPNSSSVYEYAAAEFGDLRVAFAGNWTLHCVTWLRGDSTRVSRSVAEVPERWFSASRSTSCIEAAVGGDGGQVVWIDTRYGRTDRTPLNPLGGIPWSDAPDWGNNDVFALPIAKIIQGGSGVGKLVPSRLTRDLSFTQCLRAHATSRAVYVAWAGWSRYRRDHSHRDTPPSMWYTTLPLH
jgi:hypothetical protein